jgi:hypothetical protein
MRIPHSKTLLGGLLALLGAVSSAEAQSGRASLGAQDLGQPSWSPDGGGMVAQGGVPPGGAWGPGPYGVPGAGFQPLMSPPPPQHLYPPGGPETMNPWPAISPFEPAQVAYTQHRIEKTGFWVRDTVHRQTTDSFSLEYVSTSFGKPESALVGSPHAPISPTSANGFGFLGQEVRSDGLGPAQPLDSVTSYYYAAHPFPFLLIDVGPPPVNQAIIDGTLFPIRDIGDLNGPLEAPGIRGRWERMHEDGTGWGISANYVDKANMIFNMGVATVNGVPISQAVLLANPALMFTKNGAIPLIYNDDINDGSDKPVGFLGVSQKFDVLFHMEWESNSFGMDANRFTGTMYDSGATRLTSFIGGRYLYLEEHFGFRGIDSGFGYEFETDPDEVLAFRPDPASIVIDYPLMHSFLNSDVRSHLAGPQIGMQFDLGKGKGFHVWGQSIFGLMANMEEMKINGDNIGVPNLLARPDMHDGTQFLDNSFTDDERHTHISPLLEQSFNADIRVSSLIPALEKSYFFEETQLRLGYTATFVGAVSRPGDSINWRGFPQFPTVRVDRSNLLMQQLSVGLNVSY